MSVALSVVDATLARMEWADWTQIMQGRVYGADHEDAGPRADRVYGELVAGPLDGLLLDVTGTPESELRAGVELRTEIGAHGPGGRARYALRAGPGRYLEWRGDTP